MGIPLELLSMLGSALFSGLMTIWGMKLKHAAQTQKALIDRATLQGDLFTQAREYKGSSEFHFTRRTIAILSVLAILILPKILGFIAPIFEWDIAITYGWTQVESGFWFWSDDETVVKWKAVEGLVITPLDTHVVSSIIGMYFGNSVVRNV